MKMKTKGCLKHCWKEDEVVFISCGDGDFLGGENLLVSQI